MKVGDKVKGFDFDQSKYGFVNSENKKKYIGKEGVVGTITNDFFTIDFEDNWWLYPLELAHLAQIEWQANQGDMIEVSDNNINWHELEFVAKVDKFNYPYVVICGKSCIRYKYARPIETKIYFSDETIEEIKNRVDKMLRGKLFDQATLDELKAKL